MSLYRPKGTEFHALTWPQLMAHAALTATSTVAGVPWQFSWRGHVFTHEQDNLYMCGDLRVGPSLIVIDDPHQGFMTEDADTFLMKNELADGNFTVVISGNDNQVDFGNATMINEAPAAKPIAVKFDLEKRPEASQLHDPLRTVAQNAGVPYSVVAHLLSGKKGAVSVETYVALCEQLPSFVSVLMRELKFSTSYFRQYVEEGHLTYETIDEVIEKCFA